jgi:hypothetical protein
VTPPHNLTCLDATLAAREAFEGATRVEEDDDEDEDDDATSEVSGGGNV